jgi:hypothetical protein
MPDAPPPKPDFLGLLPDELARFLRGLGQPGYRARQVFAWLHRGAGFAEMTDLPKPLREPRTGPPVSPCAPPMTTSSRAC